jgi:Fe2+ or Zn2+ uptake regulation protein
VSVRVRPSLAARNADGCTTSIDLSGLVLPVEKRRGFALEGAEVTFSGRCPMCARDPSTG